MLTIGLDVGSVRRLGGFSWAAVASTGAVTAEGSNDPGALGAVVVCGLVAGEQIAVAAESPLAVPVPDLNRAADLGRGRNGEGSRPWSAGAGAGAMATGLVQLGWLCRYIATHRHSTTATTAVDAFQNGRAELLLAEAFVSSDGKPEPVDGRQDHADAVAAARRLSEMLRNGERSDVSCHPHLPLNLAAAAAMFAGLRIDPREITNDIFVAKVRPMTP